MTREEKVAEVEALRATVGAARGAVLTDFRGRTVAELTDLRKHLRQASVSYRVVKNTLARRAIQGSPLAGLAKFFEGPTGVALSAVDPVAPARALAAWAKQHPALPVKAGVVEGVVMGPADLAAVATLPGREVLLGQALAVLQAPLRNLASVLHGQIRGLAAVLDQVGRRRERG